MSMRQLLLGAALSLSACNPTHQFDLPSAMRISSEISEENAEVIIAAAEKWRVATNGRAKLDISISDERRGLYVVAVDDLPEGIFARSLIFAEDAARIQIDQRVVEFYSRDFPDSLLIATMHEMGHIFGLEHREDGGLMEATPDFIDTEIDAESVAQVCRIYGGC